MCGANDLKPFPSNIVKRGSAQQKQHNEMNPAFSKVGSHWPNFRKEKPSPADNINNEKETYAQRTLIDINDYPTSVRNCNITEKTMLRACYFQIQSCYGLVISAKRVYINLWPYMGPAGFKS